MNRCRRLWLPSLCAALALASCSPDEAPVARIGDGAITVADFKRAATIYGGNYPLPPDSARRRLLSDMVARLLLAQYARQLGYDREPGYTAAMERAEMPVLSDALFRDYVGGEVAVSDAEVREFYRQRGFETHARLIATYDRISAERALAEIRAGVEFRQAADRHGAPGLVPPGGDIGWVAPGSLFDPVDEELRTRPPGWVSEVLPLPSRGFVIVQVVERRPRPQGPFESQAAPLRDLIAPRKQRTLAVRLLDQLRQHSALTPVPGGSQYLFQKFTSLRAPSFLGRDVGPTMPDFSEQELARALVTWRGGVYTVRQAVDDLMTANQRPHLAMLPQIEEFLRGYALQRVAVSEAKRRGLDLVPAVADRLQRASEEWLISRLYERTIVPRAAVSAEELQDLYLRHRSQLMRVQQVELRWVAIPDSALAERLVRAAAGAPGPPAGADFPARAEALGLRPREERVDVPSHPQRWTPFEDLFASMAEGDVAGPFLSPEGWLVFQLVTRRASTPSFEELDAVAQRDLMGEALSGARQRLLNALTDSLRSATGVYELYPQRLRAVPWPLATEPPLPGAS